KPGGSHGCGDETSLADSPGLRLCVGGRWIDGGCPAAFIGPAGGDGAGSSRRGSSLGGSTRDPVSRSVSASAAASVCAEPGQRGSGSAGSEPGAGGDSAGFAGGMGSNQRGCVGREPRLPEVG